MFSYCWLVGYLFYRKHFKTILILRIWMFIWKFTRNTWFVKMLVNYSANNTRMYVKNTSAHGNYFFYNAAKTPHTQWAKHCPESKNRTFRSRKQELHLFYPIASGTKRGANFINGAHLSDVSLSPPSATILWDKYLLHDWNEIFMVLMVSFYYELFHEISTFILMNILSA